MVTGAATLDAYQSSTRALDVTAVRRDFPILAQRPNGRRLVYLDNAATTQTPQVVMDAMDDVYKRYYSNIHRGVYRFSELTTSAYEGARESVRGLLNAAEASEIVFVRGATEAINLVAESLGRSVLQAGDEVVLTEMEHHANIVPWQRLRDERGVVLRVVGVTEDGQLNLEELGEALGAQTRLVAVTHVSNTLGTVNPIGRIGEMARAVGAWLLVDGAQAIPHQDVDVRRLGCDFYVFSGHKMYGPTGIGVLYGKMELLERLPPYQLGGDMIRSVTFEKSTFADVPQRFEAGTPNIVGSIGLGEAIRYLESVGMNRIAQHEQALLAHATTALDGLRCVRIHGTAPDKAAVLSFTVEGIHPHDIGTILDGEGIAVRTGHHCTQPLMHKLGVAATTRASFGMYNTHEDVDALVHALEIAIGVLR